MARKVDWNQEKGGCCPECGSERVPVSSSPPWRGGVKFRSHRCACGATFQSVQMSDEARLDEVSKLREVAVRTRAMEEELARLNRIFNYA